MDKMLYISMTGASHNTKALQSHANNLANVSTSGFKRDFEQARSISVFGDGLPARAYALSAASSNESWSESTGWKEPSMRVTFMLSIG